MASRHGRRFSRRPCRAYSLVTVGRQYPLRPRLIFFVATLQTSSKSCRLRVRNRYRQFESTSLRQRVLISGDTSLGSTKNPPPVGRKRREEVKWRAAEAIAMESPLRRCSSPLTAAGPSTLQADRNRLITDNEVRAPGPHGRATRNYLPASASIRVW
jgi:hypothetical protein